MIKEIEVGGVKHSITLADDMVGSGLVKEPSGKVLVSVSTDVLSGGYFMTGLAFSGGKLILQKEPIANALSGDGLISQFGSLSINVTGIAKDQNIVSGLARGLASGLTGRWDKGWEGSLVSSLACGLAGTGLIESGGKLSVTGVDISANTLCGTGLFASGNKLSINSGIAGSGLAYTPGYEPKMDVCINTDSGLGYDHTTTPSVIYVKLAKRSSGLRLILNNNGELDVTQD